MSTSAIASLLNVIALATIMLATGMQVKIGAVTASIHPVRRIALGLVANYFLVPAVAIGLLFLFQAAPLVAAGFLILAVCPGAPIGPLATKIAKGNIPWSIGMMVILAGLSAVLSPALLGLLLSFLTPDSSLEIDYLAIIFTLLVVQLLPLAAGLAIQHWLPKVSDKAAKPTNAVANFLLLALVGMILFTQYETLAAVRLRGWAGMMLLFAACIGIGWLCGGSDASVRRALAVTTSGRNAAVGLAIVTGNFAGTPAVTAVVAFAIVSILGTFLCAALFGRTTPSPKSQHESKRRDIPSVAVNVI